MNCVPKALPTLALTVMTLGACSSSDSDNKVSLLTQEEKVAAELHLAEEQKYLDGELDEEEFIDEEAEFVLNDAAPATAAALSASPSNAVIGVVSEQFAWPLYAIHTVMLPSGNVLSYGSYPKTNKNGKLKAQTSMGLRYDIWTPGSGTSTDAHSTLPVESSTNVFCSAQTLLNSGDLLITGGDALKLDASGTKTGTKNDGIDSAQLYSAGVMSNTNKMAYRRWYPTVVPLSDGKVLVHGGRVFKNGKGSKDDTIATTPEIYDPATKSFTALSGAENPDVYDSQKRGWYYPRSWLDEKGRVFFYKVNNSGFYTLDPTGSGDITHDSDSEYGKFSHVFPSVMYRKNKILSIRAGRVTTSIDLHRVGGKVQETRLTSIPTERYWSDATVMADGKVLVSGGASRRQKLDHAVFDLEIYNPKSDTWITGPKTSSARLYHSSSILLKSGAVLMAGGGPPGPIANLTAEIYYPSYLFDSSGELATRPAISNMAEQYSYGDTAELTFDAASVSKVSQVRLGSTTHSYDMGQSFRTLEHKFNNGALSVTLPEEANSSPPGYYMLFAFDDAGTPSEGMPFKLE